MRDIEQQQPLLYDGGMEDDGEAAAQAENAPEMEEIAVDAAPKKQEMTDEQAIAAAKERQKAMDVLRRQQQKLVEEGMEDTEGGVRPGQLQGQFMRMLRKAICCRFWIIFVIYGILVVIAEVCRASYEKCGIDVILWVEVVFGIVILSAFLQVQTYWILSCGSLPAVIGWYITVIVVSVLIAIGWLIYGLVIYFSEANDCQEYPDQFGWLVVMVLLLFFGCFALLVLILSLCIGSCLVCCAGQQNADNADRTFKQLTKKVYDPEQFNKCDKCVICQCEFEENDKVTPLPCHESHVFHTACLEKNIEAGNLNCPICNARITA